MKNLLLLLLLANILYFVWGMFSEEDREPGVAIVEESELGPPLEVTMDRGAEASAVVGRSCVTVGPFRHAGDAEVANTQYAGEGMRTSLRSTHGEIFIGHWVLIANIADNLARRDMLDKLHAGGLTDAYPMESEDTGLGISLGLFGELEGAEKVELQAKSLDLPAQIVARTSESQIFFVDVALPPGKGAGAIVDKYGEDKVLLRDAATCPQST